MKKHKPDKYPKTLKVIPQRFQNVPLKVPKIEYKVVAQPVLKTAFTGHVTAIPTVLIFYLNSIEFKVVATIIQETMETGMCILTAEQMATRLKSTKHTIYDTIYHLRKMGVIYQYKQGYKVVKVIDFKAVQKLNDLLLYEDRGMYRRLRTKMRYRDINHITQDDLKKAYDLHVLPIDHDIEEEEEYD